jgi:hypothetical protein
MLRALAAACLLLLAVAGVQTWRLQAERAERAAEVLAQAQARATLEAQARQLERTHADNARRAADTYRAHLARLQGSAAAAGAELERLRDDLAAGGSASEAAATGRGADDADPARRVVSECAGALAQVAAAADACEARLTGLQAYVRGVSPP